MRRMLSFIGLFALLGVACSPKPHGGSGQGGNAGSAGGGGAPGGGGTATGTTSTGMGADGGGGLFESGAGPTGSGGGQGNCAAGPDEDKDKDGWTINQGDCNDCDPNVNPGAVEVLTKMGDMAADENCNGLVDAKDPDILPCDNGLLIDGSAMDGAKAIDICRVAAKKSWGVVSAKWTLANGDPPPPGNANFDLGHGLLAGFGPNVKVQHGSRMLGVSSGSARAPLDPGYQSVNGFSKGYQCTEPMGFPKESPLCGVAVSGGCFDAAALDLKIHVPTNAHGFSFNFNFFTFEWPGFVCTQYNDFFTAILSPIPKGQTDGNITFDQMGDPVSVNNAFVRVCGCMGGPPCMAGGKTFTCPLGDLGIIGTGFGPDTAFSDHGSTSWLNTQAPVDPGTDITLRFAAWDSGDGVLDTTGLVDNFQWIATPGTVVGTTPIPTPK